MSYDAFSHFLRKAPRPSKLKTDQGDLITVGTTGSWIKAARETLDGLAWGRVDALDSTGAIIRSLASDVDAEPVAAAESLSSDQTTAIAQLLLQAADQACERQAAAYEMSMDRFLALIQISMQRLQATEEMLARMQVERAQLLQAAAGDGDGESGLSTMIAAAMGMPGKTIPSPPSGGNGVGSH